MNKLLLLLLGIVITPICHAQLKSYCIKDSCLTLFIENKSLDTAYMISKSSIVNYDEECLSFDIQYDSIRNNALMNVSFKNEEDHSSIESKRYMIIYPHNIYRLNVKYNLDKKVRLDLYMYVFSVPMELKPDFNSRKIYKYRAKCPSKWIRIKCPILN